MRVKVKAGKELAHAGDVLLGGAELDLPPSVAAEFPHLLDEVLPSGEVRAIGAPDPSTQLAADLERARPHERISILKDARAKLGADAQLLDDLIAAEEKRLAADAAPKSKVREIKSETPAVPAQKE